MIDYVFYSTSKSDYQNWQRDLLEYSFKKVNQPGKLISYCSANEHNVIPKTIHVPSIEMEINCPDFMKSFGEKNYGIANKLFSIKLWLETFPDLSGTVLFMDPDMVFLSKIDVLVEEGTICGQLWDEPGVANHRYFMKYTPDDLKERLIRENIFMFPFCINIKDMQKILPDFISYSSTIYQNEACWEADMYGIVIAAIKSNLKIIGHDFGCCNNWTQLNQNEFSVAHYPSVVFNDKKEKIWFKQDFTEDTLVAPWSLKPSCRDTTNRVEYSLLSSIKEYINIQTIKAKCPDMFYWNKKTLGSTVINYKSNNQYVICNPWAGGFNNIRMSLEIAAAIAFRLNRILVVPDPYKMYLLDNKNGFDTFFEFRDLGIDVLSLTEFSKKINIQATWSEVSKISKVYNFAPDNSYINLGSAPCIIDVTSRKEILISTSDTYIYFDKNLLGNFYSVINDNDIDEIKNYICKNIHYKESIFAQSYNIIEFLNGEHGTYYSMHLRRNDFQYKDLFINDTQLLKNISNSVPKGSCLYISTDIKEKSELGILNSYYNVVILKDVIHLLDKYINSDLYGMIEQIVCTRALRFIGTKNSTFSTYIYRMRGYMEDINDKTYIINTSEIVESENSITKNWEGNHNSWSREYREAFDYNTSTTIFVSIASYRDSQLEPTIDDLFKKAKNPGSIIVGVCMQDTAENFANFKYKDNKQVKTLFIPYEDAKGVCYARSLIQTELLSDEQYYLQIDSHSRFAYNWDKHLANHLQSCPSEKPILSCYPNNYNLSDDKESYLKTTTLSPHRYMKFADSTLRTISSGKSSKTILLSNWIAAGFIFTRSTWCREVGYAKNILFNGEEDYLFLKSFLKQYEIYCPPLCSVYHCYANNTKGSAEKYRNLVFEDMNANKLKCSKQELTDLLESFTDENYKKFVYKYGACYKTQRIIHNEIQSGEEIVIERKEKIFEDVSIYPDKLNIYLWGVSDDKAYMNDQCSYSLKTANKFGLSPQILGINYDFSFMSHLKWNVVLSRLYLLRDICKKDDTNKIMIFMDGFDTLFNGTETQIVEKFKKFNTKILFSAEKYFTYQWPNYKDKYDKIDSLYRYINAGTFMGYSNDLYNMACSCIGFLEKCRGEDRGNDQGIFGKYVYENIENPDLIQLDTNCSIFWVTTSDNDILTKHGTFNKNTETNPLIFHIIGGRREYMDLYKTISSKIMGT